jgi:hypothetical protein
MFDTSVVTFTVITGGGLPPFPPPQDTIVMAPATTRMLSRQARVIMELSLQSEVEITRGTYHSVHPSAKEPSGATAPTALCVFPSASPSRELLMRN